MSLVDEEDLAEKMDYFINNYDQIESYSQQARNYAVKYLNWEVNSKDIPKYSKVQSINILKANDIKTFVKETKKREFMNVGYYFLKVFTTFSKRYYYILL